MPGGYGRYRYFSICTQISQPSQTNTLWELHPGGVFFNCIYVKAPKGFSLKLNAIFIINIRCETDKMLQILDQTKSRLLARAEAYQGRVRPNKGSNGRPPHSLQSLNKQNKKSKKIKGAQHSRE